MSRFVRVVLMVIIVNIYSDNVIFGLLSHSSVEAAYIGIERGHQNTHTL